MHKKGSNLILLKLFSCYFSFMYTGQLEYNISDQDALYHTAQKMKIALITQLLDTQLEKCPSENILLENVDTASIQKQSTLNIKQCETSPAIIQSEKM